MKTFKEYLNEQENVNESLFLAGAILCLAPILGGMFALALDSGDDVTYSGGYGYSSKKRNMFLSKLFSKLMSPEKKLELAKKILNDNGKSDAKTFLENIKSSIPENLLKTFNRIESRTIQRDQEAPSSEKDLEKNIEELKEYSKKYIAQIKDAKNAEFKHIEFNKPLKDLKIGDWIIACNIYEAGWFGGFFITSLRVNDNFVTIGGKTSTNKYREAIIDLDEISAGDDYVEYYDNEYKNTVCFTTNPEKFFEFVGDNMPKSDLETAKEIIEFVKTKFGYVDKDGNTVNNLHEKIQELVSNFDKKPKNISDLEKDDYVFYISEYGNYEIFKLKFKRPDERFDYLETFIDYDKNRVCSVKNEDANTSTCEYSFRRISDTAYKVTTDIKEFIKEAENILSHDDLLKVANAIEQIENGSDSQIFTNIKKYEDKLLWRIKILKPNRVQSLWADERKKLIWPNRFDEYEATHDDIIIKRRDDDEDDSESPTSTTKYNYHPKTKEKLEELLEKLIKKRGPQADLNDIDVSKITDMESLFDAEEHTYAESFNGDISNWDVSNVINMGGMFYGSNFNGDISNWDTSNVENMNSMFFNSNFNGDIEDWNVDHIADMDDMFNGSPLENDEPSWYVD